MLNHTYQLITRYETASVVEQQSKDQLLNFMTSNEDCFLRSCILGHITASGFLLNRDMTHALLMHHAKLNIWVQPGGHCDGDTDVARVALKEAQEECGIEKIKLLMPEIFDIDIHLIPANDKEHAHYHYDIRFLLHAYANDDLTRNHESKALRWFNISGEDLPTDSISVVRMFKKARENLNTIFNIKENNKVRYVQS